MAEERESARQRDGREVEEVRVGGTKRDRKAERDEAVGRFFVVNHRG